jgi:1-phosphofructokinase family hexose kinase
VILAAGLTPAWQQILLFDSFHTGEVNRALEAHWCASGKVLNVGRALHHLGAPCKTLALLGGDSGTAIQREFAQLGIAARWVPSAATTRICTTIIDHCRTQITELVENAPPVAAAELAAFADAYAEEAAAADIVVLSGSLPLGAPATYYRDLLDRTHCPVVLDARGPELLSALECSPHADRCLLVKPNREELARTLGREIRDEALLFAAMRELNRRGAQWVVVTQGKEAVWLSSADNAYRAQPPSAAIVNPIGCGDCLAAGLAWGLHEQSEGAQLIPAADRDDSHTPLTALRLGLAAAADNVAQLLPARLGRERVRALALTIEVERLECN